MNREKELLEKALQALEDNREMIQEWGGYASDYFQEKHKLQDDVCANDGLILEIRGVVE